MPKFAPWTWSCGDEALARVIEGKLRALGVRGELCVVRKATVEENELSGEIWGSMKN